MAAADTPAFVSASRTAAMRVWTAPSAAEGSLPDCCTVTFTVPTCWVAVTGAIPVAARPLPWNWTVGEAEQDAAGGAIGDVAGRPSDWLPDGAANRASFATPDAAAGAEAAADAPELPDAGTSAAGGTTTVEKPAPPPRPVSAAAPRPPSRTSARAAAPAAAYRHHGGSRSEAVCATALTGSSAATRWRTRDSAPASGAAASRSAPSSCLSSGSTTCMSSISTLQVGLQPAGRSVPGHPRGGLGLADLRADLDEAQAGRAHRQQLPLVRRERLQPGQQLDAVHHAGGQRVAGAAGVTQQRQDHQPAPPPRAVDGEVAGDAEQPVADRTVGGPVGGPPAPGAQEGLGGEVLGVVARGGAEVGEHDRRLAVVQLQERLLEARRRRRDGRFGAQSICPQGVSAPPFWEQ